MQIKTILALIFALVLCLSMQAQELVRVYKINIEGLKRTKEAVVLHELFIEEGQTLSLESFEKSITRSIKELEDLALFSDVEIKPIAVLPSIEDQELDRSPYIVQISLKERWTLIPFISYNYDSKLGSTIPFALIESNLFGYNKQLILAGQYNHLNNNYTAIYNDPAIDYSLWSMSLGYLYATNERFEYDDQLQMIAASKRLQHIAFLGIGYNYSLEKEYRTSLYTSYVNQDDTLQYGDKDAVFSLYNNDFLLLRIEQDWGRIYSYKGLLSGNKLALVAGFTPYYSQNFDMLGSMDWQSFWMNAKKSYHLGLRSRYNVRQNETQEMRARGLKKDELNGNNLVSAQAFYRQEIFTLKEPSPFALSLYWFNDLSYLFSSNWDEPIAEDNMRYVLNTGLSFYLNRINLPIDMSISYVYSPAQKNEALSFNLGITSLR